MLLLGVGSVLNVQFGGAMLYVASAIAYLAYLTSPRKVLARIATVGLISGVVGHAVCFVVRALGAGLPLTSTGVILSGISMTIAAVWLVAQFYTGAIAVGAFVAPVAAVFAILAAALPSTEAMTAAPIPLLVFHIITVSVGIAVFALAGCTGVAYLIQERQVKRKTTGKLFRRLPSLDVLDKVGYRSQASGFVMLTLALISGAMMTSITGSKLGFHIGGEVIATLLLWGFYAGALQTRLFAGWRGRKGAWFAVVGFVLLNIAFLGIRVFSAIS